MLRTALIGYPQVGKSALFQLMTAARDGGRPSHGKAEVTIGVARVPDPRLDVLTAMFNPRKRVPATVEFADIPGRASGTGAEALLDVVAYRNADALVHVLRAFVDPAIAHASGSIDPRRDARTMEDELILADLAVVEKRLDRLAKDLKKGRTPELEREQDILARCRIQLESGAPLRAMGLGDDDRRRLRGFQFLSAKPLLLVVNVDEADLMGDHGASAALDGVVARYDLGSVASGAATGLVAICAKIELEIAQLEPGDAAAFLADLGLKESGLDRVIRASYDLLGYISFFTVGEDECRAWSIPQNLSAQAAAGEIHTDLSRGFIRAEVVAYERLTSRQTMQACREHGEVRLEGKEYVVVDGDIMNIRFAT
ncbi:MAG: redox-regulated ATPase YchF [Acidobacteriota bacterium]